LTLPSGIVTDYTVDEMGRIVMLTHYAPDQTPETLSDNGKLAEFHYTYLADGNRSSAVETFWGTTTGLAQTTNLHWTYDALNRLVSEQYAGYDASGAALSYLTTYTFDRVGNRLTKVTDASVDGYVSTPGSLDETITYLYDANDRLLVEMKDLANPALADTTTTYTFGPTVQTGKHVENAATGAVMENVAYAYNLQGRLDSATIERDGAVIVTQYAYGDDGIRYQQIVTQAPAEGSGAGEPVTTTHDYLIDPRNLTGYAQVLEERINEALVKAFTIAHDMLAQHSPDHAALSLLTDAHGSTRLLANALAQAVERYAYDAYGVALGFDETTALTSMLYSGEQTDGLIEVQHLRARFYDPRSGRFISGDPASGVLDQPETFGRYAYVSVNPISRIDPSGATSQIELGVAMFIATALTVMTFPNNANAPDLDDGLLADVGGNMVIGLAFSLVLAGPFVAMGRFLIRPASGAAKNIAKPIESRAAVVADSAAAESSTGATSLVLREVNPFAPHPVANPNCGNTAYAMHFNMAGRPAVALPRDSGMMVVDLERALNARFGSITNELSSIHTQIVSRGNYAMAIVQAGNPATGASHFLNAININGRVFFVDAQSAISGYAESSVGQWMVAGYTHFRALVTP
jgi:RHS repeat-associated protein